MTVWVEVGDLIDFASRHDRPSGIQRVGFEIALALSRTVPAPGYVAFCRIDAGQNRGPAEVSQAELSATYAALRSGHLRRDGEASRPERVNEWPTRQAHLAPGDVLLTLSPPLGSWDFTCKVQELVREGVRLVMFVHDIIPILHPEWCEEWVISEFEPWLQALVSIADTVLTSSRSVARDLAEWANRASLHFTHSITVVRLGSRFTSTGSSPLLELPQGVDVSPEPGFALFVSTVEPRKNHSLAIEVWRRSIAALGSARVPQLVCVGRVGWLVDDLLQRLSDESYLGGKVILLEGVPDWQLEHLYASCKFSLFPSHYEGYGLPVTESLAFGKLCLASNGGAIPEAGGEQCVYFDPRSEEDAEAAVRAILESPPLLTRLTAAVKAEFNEVTWDATAQDVLAAISGRSRPSSGYALESSRKHRKKRF